MCVYIYICIIYKNVYIYVKTQIYEYIEILDLTNARTHTVIVINANSIPSRYIQCQKRIKCIYKLGHLQTRTSYVAQ